MTNVVLLSHERPRLIRQAIESLYANTARDQFTCTVVDDDSQDFRTKKFLRSLTYSNFSLLEVHNSGHVLAQLKNLGVFYSRQRFGAGDWLHLGDGDVYFMPGWLENLTALASKTEGYERVRLWGGQIHPFHEGNPHANWRMTTHQVLDGPSWLMRWKTWRDYGPLDRKSAAGACQSEEYPFCERIIASGHRIAVTFPHYVIHTGLTQSNGQDAPGAEERRKMIPKGVIAE